MEEIIKDYNTDREKLALPEYGRNVKHMVEHLKTIEDRAKRSEQAAAVVKVMEILNPSVRQQDDFEHKLWDHLYMIADFDLDIDSPYPMPAKEELSSKPARIPINKKPVRATHYGRNIESIIDLITKQEQGEVKTELIRTLAIYMRQQYLIWNKDSVADETIFSDIEKLSEGRVKVPEGITLSRISSDANSSRPGIGNQSGSGKKARKKNFQRKK
ncbi:MAG: DUF4290 domain-containing protein [Bacteroidales bacterium]|nr:DUF4290 domain-containing protein [Bacteroidales bacterium]